jgi:hypothetical protein
MSASEIGLIGIALVVLGAIVWVFRPGNTGEFEFEFLGLKAKLNAAGVAVMTLGIILILASLRQSPSSQIEAQAPPSETCPNIAGVYNAKEKAEKLSVTQSECFFRGHVQLDNEDVVAMGFLNQDNSGTDFVISHRKSPECSVRYFGELNNITTSGFTSHIYSTDGRCGMSTNWNEYLTWEKQ